MFEYLDLTRNTLKQSFTYFGLFFIGWFILNVIMILLIGLIGDSRSKSNAAKKVDLENRSDSRGKKVRVKRKSKNKFIDWIQIILFIALLFSPCPVVYTGLQALEIEQPQIVATDKNTIQIKSLSVFKELTIVNNKLDKLDKLSLSELRALLNETVEISQKVEDFATRQEFTVSRLRKEVEAATTRADEARRLAEEIKSITKPQLEAVKLLITEDATKASKESFWLGAAISFPIGILASLTASFTWSYLFKKKG